MWKLKLVSFCTSWWMQCGHGPCWVWVQLTIMMHAIKTWHLLSTHRLLSLLQLWAWVCPLLWDACHLPEPHQPWWESRGGCRHYQQTTSTLFPSQLSGSLGTGSSNLPAIQNSRWMPNTCLNEFQNLSLSLIFEIVNCIYLKDCIHFLLILSCLSFHIRQFLLISFCRNCLEVSFMLAHQKMRPVVLQNNTSKILLILGFFSEKCFIKGFQWSSFFNTSLIYSALKSQNTVFLND